jgi:hypothetical protein
MRERERERKKEGGERDRKRVSEKASRWSLCFSIRWYEQERRDQNTKETKHDSSRVVYVRVLAMNALTMLKELLQVQRAGQSHAFT